MAEVRGRSCPQCGARRAEPLMPMRFVLFDGSALPGSFDWVVCSECGLSYYDTAATQEQLDAYYAGNAYYLAAATAGSGGYGPLEQQRFGATAECISRHLSGTDAVVFDVGSGKGGLLCALRDRGYRRLCAVDMAPACAEYVRSTLGLSAETGTAMHLPFGDTTPDCCVYSHVLEHALDPAAIIREAWLRLSDNGILYAEAPDAAAYGVGVQAPWTELYLEHLNHFDVAHLSALVCAQGFEVLEQGVKQLPVNATESVQCAYGVFRKRTVPPPPTAPDLGLTAHLRSYVTRCANMPMHARLDELASSKAPVYVWGMSQYAQLLLGSSALGRCAIAGYVDGDPGKRTRTIAGRPVQAPEVLASAPAHSRVVLTGIGFRAQMRDALTRMHFRGIEVALD